MSNRERIIQLNIEEEMTQAYIDYSMSVIVSRALPDVRDGLKPVHRRVLYGMSELGVASDKPPKKSARIVGEVLGKFHPHGDSSVYFAMVRMAQEWSLRYPLVDGQGNFGSIDGDSPAAMRYTEARLKKIAEEIMADIDKDTVDFQLNFDDSLTEPTVMPTRIPNLLINGTQGIAVGMATNMPPHNLTDTLSAIIAYIQDPEVDINVLIDIIQAPDFPTGGTIYGYQGIRDAYTTGRGRCVIRGKATIETDEKGREKIIVSEIPYMVNKAEMIARTADLINEKKIEGISEVNDESDRDGMRIVYTLKRDAIANVELNKLYKFTALQSTFSINSIALVDGRPEMLNLKDLIKYFVEHRHDVVIRRTRYELNEAQKRAHILEGLIIASDNIDEVVKIIRASKSPDEAREALMTRFNLSEIQSRAIVDMRLRHLTGLEQDKLRAEYEELMKLIDYLNSVLADIDLRMKIITDELLEIKQKFGDERRTEIVRTAEEFNPEDFYADEDMVITISHMGYMKRTSLSEYKIQNRGGVGSKGADKRDSDFIEHIYIANMHSTMLFFTRKGRCFWLKTYDIPEGNKATKGRAIQNLLNIEQDDKVMAYINVRTLADEEYINNNFIILGTRNGIIKKTSLEEYSRPRVNGVNAITVREGDELLEARLTNGKYEIILAVKSGKAIRFNETKVRAIGRTASGVKGVDLDEGDEVIGMICVEPNTDKHILVVSENGYGKRSDIDDYRITNRGAKGVKTMNITDKTGSLVAIKDVIDSDDLMIITKSGLTIRTEVSALRVMGRNTQGVKLINLRKNDQIGAVTAVAVSEEERQERENEKLLADNPENGELNDGTIESENEEIEPNSETGENQTEEKPTETEND